MERKYTIHVWDYAGIGREVASRRTLRDAISYAKQEAPCYDGGLYVCRPDGVVVTGDGSYMRDGRLCNIRGRLIEGAVPDRYGR